MGRPIDENRSHLNYWLFYAQRCVAYAHAEVMRAHCEERGKPYVITPHSGVHFETHLQQIIANVSEIGPGLGDRFGLLPKEVM